MKDSRDVTPEDAVPPGAVRREWAQGELRDEQQEPEGAAELEDRRPGAASLKARTIWLYPVCSRIRALRASAAIGSVLLGWLPIVSLPVWGERAALRGLIALGLLIGFFYLIFRVGWVEVGTDQIAVQDTMLGSQRIYKRGEVSAVILRNRRLSISGDDGIPHTRRLRRGEERKLRRWLRRHYWI